MKASLIKKTIAVAVLTTAVMGLAPALAQSTDGQAAPTPMLTSTGARKTLDIACVQTAVNKRETAIGAAWTAKASAISSALSARASALSAAWQIATAKDRNAAVKAAWKAYASAVSVANKAMRTARMGAWSAFAADRKACHATASQVDSAAGAAADAGL